MTLAKRQEMKRQLPHGRVSLHTGPIAGLAFLALVAVLAGPLYSSGPAGVAKLLPAAADVTDWKSLDTAREYSGEELFLLIDGGAEIYLEYGFVRVAEQEYADDHGHDITCQVFEMKDPAAAYGIFSFVTGGKEQNLTLGNGARKTSYYLSFWKGSYLATLTALDSSQASTDGLMALARAIEGEITETAEPPVIIRLLPPIDNRRPMVTYVRGPIALGNRYRFDTGNIFGAFEGVVGDYTDYSLFLFRYGDSLECQKRFAASREALAAGKNYHDLRTAGDVFSAIDAKGKYLRGEIRRNYFVLCLGRTAAETEAVIDALKGTLK